MSKKHFIRIADAIRDHNRRGMDRFSAAQLETLAGVLREQNPAFKTDRWLGYIAGENGPNGGAR
jgi:hypothetical protein